jgi:cobalt/nickel transport system permease protein
MEMKAFTSLIGNLLLRTWERAERIYRAMLCRGFNGEFHVQRNFRFGMKEALFTIGWSSLFVVLRLVNVPQFIGTLFSELLR